MQSGTADKPEIGSSAWNDQMFGRHPTPYTRVAGMVEKYRVQQVLRIIKDYHRQNSDFTVVEIGCEAGNLLKQAKEAFPSARMIGVDISRDALEQARKALGSRVELVTLNLAADDPKLPIDKIDYLICSETLEHIPDVEKAVANLAKMADKKTLVIITVPDEKIKNIIKRILSRFKVFKFFSMKIEEGFSEWHLHDFSKDDILKVLSRHFRILKYKKLLFLHQLIVAQKFSTKDEIIQPQQ